MKTYSDHIQEDFNFMAEMLKDIQNEIKDYPELQQIGFYTPLKRILYEAAHEIIQFNRDNDLRKRSLNWELLHEIIFNTKDNN